MRALKIVHYDDLDNKVAEYRAAQKILRDEKKDAMLKTLSQLKSSASTDAVIDSMQQLQKELDQSAEIEKLLLEFVNSVKHWYVSY